MQNLISNTFAISAQRPTVSIDHTDNYYLIEASGITPAVNDARWQYVPVGGNVLVPTAAYPYLWHKSITYLTDGTALAPVIEFGGSLGQNGIDYDLVPSHSSILKDVISHRRRSLAHSSNATRMDRQQTRVPSQPATPSRFSRMLRLLPIRSALRSLPLTARSSPSS